MAKAWQGKHPKDMSADELQAAKEAVLPALQQAQSDLNWLSAANSLLDYEITTRFRVEGMTVQGMSPAQLPDWPAEQVAGFKPTDAPSN